MRVHLSAPVPLSGDDVADRVVGVGRGDWLIKPSAIRAFERAGHYEVIAGESSGTGDSPGSCLAEGTCQGVVQDDPIGRAAGAADPQGHTTLVTHVDCAPSTNNGRGGRRRGTDYGCGG